MAGVAGRVLLLPKGAYDASTTYNLLDFVTYEGSSYVCKKTSLNHLPTDTEYWQLLVSSTVHTLTSTLTAGQTSVTFNNALITDSSTIKVYTSQPDLLYNNIVSGTNSVTITFPEQAENVTVGIDII